MLLFFILTGSTGTTSTVFSADAIRFRKPAKKSSGQANHPTKPLKSESAKKTAES